MTLSRRPRPASTRPPFSRAHQDDCFVTMVAASFSQASCSIARPATISRFPSSVDVPVLGNLFKNKTDTIARTERLIAITPHVVQDNGQLNMIASEFRDRLNCRPGRSANASRSSRAT